MVKRILAALVLTLTLGALLSGFCLAEQAETRIWDECGLFSEEEKSAINTAIQAIRKDYDMDCGVLTTRSVPNNRSDTSEEQTVKYADAWYENSGMGLGEDRAGILYVLDMNNRVSYVSTAGVMIDYIGEGREEELLSSADEGLGRRKYGQAALSLLKKLHSILSRGIQEGHFRFDDVTGQRLTGLYNKLTGTEIAVAGGGGLLTAGLMLLGVNVRYKLKIRTYRFDKATQSKVVYTTNETTFLRERVSRTRISGGGGGGGRIGGGRSGGSGVHISSGGMSHGGGGHHF